MQEPNTMLRSAENKPTGKTMEDLVKRNALSINKSAPEITNWDDFHQTTNSATVRNYTVPTDSPPQSLPTSSSFSSKELEARQLEDACRRSEAKGVRSCTSQRIQVMPRRLEFGRAKQSSENQEAEEPRTGFSSPMFTGAFTPEAVAFSDNDLPFPTFSRALRPEPAEIPRHRTIEHPAPRLLPSPTFTGALTQGAVDFSSNHVPSPRVTGDLTPGVLELLRTLEIGGFLYQRVDMDRRDATMISGGHNGESSSGSMPLPHQRQDRLAHLDRDVPLDHNFARREVRRTDHGSRLQSIHEQNLSQAQQNIESDLAVARDEETEVQQESRVLIASQTLSYGPALTDVQLINVRSKQPTVRKSKRKSNLLRELEAHNQSPEPDAEQEKPRLRTARSVQRVPPGPRRKSLLLRELEAHNQSPEAESESEIEPLGNLKDDWRDTPLTRSASRNLENFVKARPSTPRKNLNLETLMLAEFSGMKKGTKTFYAEHSSSLGPSSSYQRQQDFRKEMSFPVEDEEEDEEEDWAQHIGTKGQSYPQPMPTRGKMRRQVKKSKGSNQRDQNLAAELAWLRWDNQKEELNGLVKSPRYKPHPSQQEMAEEGRKKPAYHVTAEIPESFQGAFHMEEGLYVFTPTVAAFSDFGHFLKDVVEIAGRKMGVVKVVVPSECLARTPSASRSRSPRTPVIKTMNVKISPNENAAEDRSKIYDMLTTYTSTSLEADEWLRIIERNKNYTIKQRPISAGAISGNDVWKESHVLQPYIEGIMIRRSEMQNGAVKCALNEPATPSLRAALNCRDPNIDNLLGNRFASSRSTEPGINDSVFHLAGGPGPLFPLQMNKYAAYSLNYHHSGAPRISTVTLPEHHAKLEEVMHVTQDSGNLFGRPRKPPTCSQFVTHQPMYVPHATLSFYGIGFTEVVQHQGEMVITFPFAYHQAYASGPNITEEILYANDRCKVFHRENLYQHCNRDCAAGQPDNFDLSMVFGHTLSSPRSGQRHRSGFKSPSTSLRKAPSSEASTSQESDVDRRPSKRISRLKTIDRVSDDDDWIDSSAQASRVKPRAHRKATSMTSNPYEPDMWDPLHAFGGSYCPADNDEGSPIGGIRRRDAATGHLLMPRGYRTSERKRGNESDESPHKNRRRRH